MTAVRLRPARPDWDGRSPRRWPRGVMIVLTGVTILLGMSAAALAPSASAHPLNTSAVLLDVGSDQVTATIEIPLDELSIAQNVKYSATSVLDGSTLANLRRYLQQHLSATDNIGQTWTTQVSGGRVAQVDGADNLVLTATLTPSLGAVGDFVLHYDAVVEKLISHRVFVSGRFGDTGSYTTLAMLSWQTTQVPVASIKPSEATGFAAAIHLGMEHISSGSDHLLFLLMLLLPAPLTASRWRWLPRQDQGWVGARRTSWRVVHVVTAFAIGHSITLAFGALGWVFLPDRVVESGIALSVLVSAIHAIRPLVRRGEVYIGIGFGLLHGLAFAALLGRLDLSRTGLVTTLLGFNLGIELTQLLVVALVMPSLLLLSMTAMYPVFRLLVGALGAVLAAGWLAQRLGIIPANPLEPAANLLVDHPLLLALGLGMLTLGAAVARRSQRSNRITTSIHPVQAPLGTVSDATST